MSQLEFDDDAARRMEAMYNSADAVRRRAIVRRTLAAAPGERVLDVGCGPGFYCVELLERLGPSGATVGVDSSPAMLALAARRCAGHDNVSLREGEAVALPLQDASVDAALTVQVLEYVHDVDAALRELHRAVRPGGRVLVWDIDWATASLSGEAARTEAVLRAWDEHLSHPSLPRTLARRLREAGFADVCMETHPLTTKVFDADSFGAALVPLIAGFVADRGGVRAEDANAWEAEQRTLGARGDFYFSCTQSCFTARRP